MDGTNNTLILFGDSLGVRKEKRNPYKKYSSYSLAVKTTCFSQCLSYLNSKGEDGFMATNTSKLKWTWQA